MLRNNKTYKLLTGEFDSIVNERYLKEYKFKRHSPELYKTEYYKDDELRELAFVADNILYEIRVAYLYQEAISKSKKFDNLTKEQILTYINLAVIYLKNEYNIVNEKIKQRFLSF